MKILIAKSSGFCMGVRRAVEMVLDASADHANPICTYGPLIHNPQVLNLLEEKGIRVLNEIPSHGSGTVLIRAHGVPPQAKEKFRKAGFQVLDATCPRVIKIQTIIEKHANQNYASIIVGDKDHPEVIGLLGYAGGRGYVIGRLDELDALPAFDQAIIVAQTTQNTRLFAAIQEWAARCFPHYKVFHTICDSTERRQAEVEQLAETVDAVIVVGGRNSGNTQRLAEIARQSGKPAFHIESETELESLDLDALTSAQSIGITAGASTPNWIIKKVYRTLEAFGFKRQQGWRSALFAIQRSLLLTNIYVSLGAGCLCYACSRLLGVAQFLPYTLISILYVQSMHIFNHITGSLADQYNDPERAAFYQKYKSLLTLLAAVSGGAGLLTAYAIGYPSFLFLLIMSIMGLSYNLRLVPERFAGFMYRRIRDIPGSKTILIAMAWGILTAILPPLSVSGEITWVNFLIFLWSASLVFVRTAFFDILDMQGDRIVGKETIALLLGQKRSMRLLKIMLMILIAILPLAGIFQLVSTLGFALTLCPLFIWLVILAHEKGRVLPGVRLEFLVETHLILAGIITLIWPVALSAHGAAPIE
ncbi:MAG: 4-hydroxy-3-methylbut-2-enyl diphosphate reductase [Desulfobacterales bacterium]|nr:MAG: 4-hydroxy-3-methylbut-2-enyl diphosphate reductase [Desulfobacterales bacterium]